MDKQVGYPQVNDVINRARPLVFDFDYPIFDINYKATLETLILRTYYLREICDMPVGRWKLMLENKMNMIMPYYNQLYQSQQLKFDPMMDTDINTTNQRDQSGNTTGNTTVNENTSKDTTGNTTIDGTNETTNMDAFSDTPQTSLSGVETLNYLTTARKVTDSGTGSQTSNDTGKETGTSAQTGNSTQNFATVDKYVEHITGKRGALSYSKMLSEYRETFININKMVLEELGELFFTVY